MKDVRGEGKRGRMEKTMGWDRNKTAKVTFECKCTEVTETEPNEEIATPFSERRCFIKDRGITRPSQVPQKIHAVRGTDSRILHGTSGKFRTGNKIGSPPDNRNDMDEPLFIVMLSSI